MRVLRVLRWHLRSRYERSETGVAQSTRHTPILLRYDSCTSVIETRASTLKFAHLEQPCSFAANRPGLIDVHRQTQLKSMETSWPAEAGASASGRLLTEVLRV